MRSGSWWPSPLRDGLPAFASARWLIRVSAVAVWHVAFLSHANAQTLRNLAVDQQGFQQGASSGIGWEQGNQYPVAGGPYRPASNSFPPAVPRQPIPEINPTAQGWPPSLVENRLASYDAPSVPRPAPPQESPLDRAVGELRSPAASQESPLDQAVRELGVSPESSSAQPAPASSGPAPSSAPLSAGGAQLKLVDISLDGLFAAGSSTATEQELQDLEGGGHDPRKRGFTVRGVELSMQGAVDPYLDGEMHSVAFIDPIQGETVFELEEAFMTTRTLPHGLQLKAGQFLTEFGRINPTHPHAWAWLDQPIIATRLFGPDGMRAPGARLGWLMPTDWFSQLYVAVQNGNGESMPSFLANEEYFEERPIGGRPFVYEPVRSLRDLVYTVRWENSWTTCCEEVTWLLGESASFGSNTTGAHGDTQMYGVDLTRKWKPAKNDRGWPFTIWMSEFMVRRYWADSFFGPNPADPTSTLFLPSETMTDCGFYTQFLYGFKPKWAIGLRYEYVWGDNYSLNQDYVPVSHNEDPFRDDRHRVSPLLAWYLTEFSRFNFQYNFDHAQHLPGKTAHSFWLGAEFMLGSHPAHKF